MLPWFRVGLEALIRLRIIRGKARRTRAVWPLNGAVGTVLAVVVWLNAAEAIANNAYHVEIITTQDAFLESPLVVSELPGGRAPSSPLLLRVAIDPAPAAVPDIAWSASGGAKLGNDLGPNFPFNEAPPGAIYLRRGSALGPFTITARVGSPVNRSITVPAYAYPLGAVGCAFGKNDGIAFDRKGQPFPVSQPDDADIYVTGPDGHHSNLFSGCSGAFVTDAADFTLHVPGGAIDLSSMSALFPKVTASYFRPPFQTSFDASRPPLLLLFRTRDGRLAKIEAGGGTGDGIAGPTLVANAESVFADATFARTARVVRALLPRAQSPLVRFKAEIGYADNSAGPYAAGNALELAFPYHESTPFVHYDPVVRVAISPTPYQSPNVSWRVSGNAVQVHGSTVTPGDHPGRATLVATVGGAVRQVVTRAVNAYDSLWLFAGGRPHGVRFTQGSFVIEPDTDKADVYLSPDSVLHFPGGGMMLTDGTDPTRQPPPGAEAAPPFADLTAGLWRADRSTLDLEAWRRMIGPGPAAMQSISERNTQRANVLLLKTRDGRFVKWHLVNSMGTSIMGGPYAVLSSGGDL